MRQFIHNIHHAASENKWFIIPYILFALVFGIVILHTDKGTLHLQLSQVHTQFWDFIFKYITLTGEWIPYAIGALLLLRKVGLGIFVCLSNAVPDLIGQLLKRAINAPRPKVFFAEHYPDLVLPTVEGISLHSNYSFPSGHTIAIFALFFALALCTGNKTLKAVYLLAAIFCAYSRIYLFQHFPVDVWAGSMIAVAATFLLYVSTKFPLRKPWSDKSIIELCRQREK